MIEEQELHEARSHHLSMLAEAETYLRRLTESLDEAGWWTSRRRDPSYRILVVEAINGTAVLLHTRMRQPVSIKTSYVDLRDALVVTTLMMDAMARLLITDKDDKRGVVTIVDTASVPEIAEQIRLLVERAQAAGRV